MVKFVQYKGKKYIVITTTFTSEDVEAPVQIQINLEDVESQHHLPIFRQASFLLNRPLRLAKSQTKQDKTSWWKRLFGTK
jgi:hypothetical protein